MDCKKYNIFIFMLSYLIFRVVSFTPEGRLAHSSVLVGNKLYFLGGRVSKSCTNQVFYLDLSQSFDLTTPPWISLTQNAGIPFKSCWGTALLNDKEQTIYLFGGLMRNDLNQDAFVSNVYSFNLNSLLWNVPTVEGTPPKRRRNMKGVIDNTGKIYIFGGGTNNAIGSEAEIYFNDMVILNTVELSWVINTDNQPNSSHTYTATLLSNGVIVYIGGAEVIEDSPKFIDIKKINLFDTKSSTWSVKIATASNIIQNRLGHTAILASDDEIIIYGGSNGGENIQVIPNLFVLNMKTEQFELMVPPVYGQFPPSLTYHTADLVGNYMVVAFVTSAISTNSDPSTTKSSPTTSIIVITNNSYSELVTMKIIIASIGGIVGVIIIMACGFLFYRWNKNKKRNEQYPRYINEEHTLPGNIVEHNSNS
ncbi:12940_t:CDS:2 [Funneliformis geosporum]|nr:12940_t:CDS:2 [Funneliformis geosporum]